MQARQTAWRGTQILHPHSLPLLSVRCVHLVRTCQRRRSAPHVPLPSHVYTASLGGPRLRSLRTPPLAFHAWGLRRILASCCAAPLTTRGSRCPTKRLRQPRRRAPTIRPASNIGLGRLARRRLRPHPPPGRAPAGVSSVCTARCVRKKHSATKCGAAPGSRSGATNGRFGAAAGSPSASRPASVGSVLAPPILRRPSARQRHSRAATGHPGGRAWRGAAPVRAGSTRQAHGMPAAPETRKELLARSTHPECNRPHAPAGAPTSVGDTLACPATERV